MKARDNGTEALESAGLRLSCKAGNNCVAHVSQLATSCVVHSSTGPVGNAAVGAWSCSFCWSAALFRFFVSVRIFSCRSHDIQLQLQRLSVTLAMQSRKLSIHT